MSVSVGVSVALNCDSDCERERECGCACLCGIECAYERVWLCLPAWARRAATLFPRRGTCSPSLLVTVIHPCATALTPSMWFLGGGIAISEVGQGKDVSTVANQCKCVVWSEHDGARLVVMLKLETRALEGQK